MNVGTVVVEPSFHV